MQRTSSLVVIVAALTIHRSVLAQPPAAEPEVRQIVTFLFQPGRSADALAIYERQLKPIYEELTPLKRLRVYRESESPEPLDLVVVSAYGGMAGMDAANAGLRRPTSTGTSAFALYGALAAMTQQHHDQFVQIFPLLSDVRGAEDGITVFEYLRVLPAARATFERSLVAEVEWERRLRFSEWSETGVMLVSDQWDYLRIHHLRSLADWQRFSNAVYRSDGPRFIVNAIAARKTIILRMEPRASVR
jgi:hypothetical protein